MDETPRIPAIPVVCSACRAALAEDSPEHEALVELLSFYPVVRPVLEVECVDP